MTYKKNVDNVQHLQQTYYFIQYKRSSMMLTDY